MVKLIKFIPFFMQGKLDDYQERMNKGERLNQDQLVKMLMFYFNEGSMFILKENFIVVFY